MRFQRNKIKELRFQLLLGAALLALLILTGCSVELEDRRQEDDSIAVQEKSIHHADFGPFEPLENPGEYLYHDTSGATLRVTSDQVFVWTQDGQSKAKRTQLKIPQDLVIDSMRLPPDEKVWIFQTTGRIFLRRNALLRFKDRHLTLRAPLIISEGAQIISYTPDESAPLGTEGRPAGIVEIEATEIRGVLHILAHGQKGGRGFSGYELQKAAAGISLPLVISDCSRAQVGGTGAAGRDGIEGQRGLGGGAGGQILLNASYDQSSRPHIDFSGGLGGEGGEGGPGQEGGEGGLSARVVSFKIPDGHRLGGARSATYICPNIPERGAPGGSGRRGQTGPHGAPGVSGFVCDSQQNMKCRM